MFKKWHIATWVSVLILIMGIGVYAQPLLNASENELTTGQTSDIPDYLKRWGSNDSKIVDFIYYFPDAPIDITTALKLWQPVMMEYKKRLHFPRPLRVMFFKKREELDSFLEKTPVAVAFLPLDYYLANKKRLRIKPYSTFVLSDKSQYSISLLVKNDSPFKGIQDLQGKKLATTKTADDHPLFLSRIVFRGEIDVEHFFSQIIYPQDGYSVVQTVSIGLADAALLPQYYLKVMKELDPTFSKKYREIFHSHPIPMAPFVYFKDNITESDIEVFQRVVQEINDLPAVKQALMFIKVKNVKAIEESAYYEVEKLWNKSP